MKIRWIAVLGTALVVTVGGLGTGVMAKSGAGSNGGVDPANFTAPLDNPYFPLTPGTVSVYRGSEEGQKLHERLTVTTKTKMILGVATIVVHDVLYADGTLREKTVDWYAPDNEGKVWYFGEATAVYGPGGHVNTEGSWEAGVDGAIAGTIMPADPEPTDGYRQEFYRGHAEDQGFIVQKGMKVTVPFGATDHVIRSLEWTRLEPNVLAAKFYAPGLGIVVEKDVCGGSEFLELVDVIQP